MAKMQIILKLFRYGFKTIGGLKVDSVLDYRSGIDGLPASDMIEYRLAGGSVFMLKPSGTEPKLMVYVSIKGDDPDKIADIEDRVCEDLESIIFMDDRMGYCCE